jgi:hypothetical protein
MPIKRFLVFWLAPILAFNISGCKDQSEAKAILPTVCQYFPGSEIYKFDQRVLWVQTHVDGISGATAMSMFTQACQKAAKSFGDVKFDVSTELKFDQRSILIFGFKRGCIACDLRDGVNSDGVPNGTIMDWKQVSPWLSQHIGYMPTAAQIRVITLEDVGRTPKGEPMQLQTLAERQSAAKEKLKVEAQEFLSQ